MKYFDFKFWISGLIFFEIEYSLKHVVKHNNQ